MMEAKGRRAPRGAGPIEAPATEAVPAEIPMTEAAPTETAASAETAAPASATISTLPSGLSVRAMEPPRESAPFASEGLAALAESQAALARGLEALGAEMAGLARSGINATTRAATEMLKVRTLSDAIAVNALLARCSFDTVVGGSAKLSELGMKLAAEASRPLLTQFGKGWAKATR
jgi:Phasin protein